MKNGNYNKLNGLQHNKGRRTQNKQFKAKHANNRFTYDTVTLTHKTPNKNNYNEWKRHNG